MLLNSMRLWCEAVDGRPELAAALVDKPEKLKVIASSGSVDQAVEGGLNSLFGGHPRRSRALPGKQSTVPQSLFWCPGILAWSRRPTRICVPARLLCLARLRSHMLLLLLPKQCIGISAQGTTPIGKQSLDHCSYATVSSFKPSGTRALNKSQTKQLAPKPENCAEALTVAPVGALSSLWTSFACRPCFEIDSEAPGFAVRPAGLAFAPAAAVAASPFAAPIPLRAGQKLGKTQSLKALSQARLLAFRRPRSTTCSPRCRSFKIFWTIGRQHPRLRPCERDGHEEHGSNVQPFVQRLDSAAFFPGERLAVGVA